jgi:acyl-coenzyme A thioesterase PaaI-like protein
VRGDLAQRGTPQSLALGFETLGSSVDHCAMRAPFRADLVADPEQGGLAGGVIFTLLDQTCGMAISLAMREQAAGEGRTMGFGGMATLDFRIDHIRAAKPGLAVTGEAKSLKIAGEIAIVRAIAWDVDPADPIAAAQAAFMLTGVPIPA